MTATATAGLTAMPPYMEKGSEGPVVDKVIQHLIDWAREGKRGSTGLTLNGQFDDRCAHWLEEYQKENGLKADGGCGPETRRWLAIDGVSLLTAKGVSKLVQLDGKELYWAPGIEASTDEAAVKAAYAKLGS